MGLVKLLVNGKEVNLSLISFEYKDEKGILSDSINLQVAGTWERPKYKDEIKAWIDDFYCGTFLVQSVKFSKDFTSLQATAIDFSGSLKEKRNFNFTNLSVCEICKTIASNHNLTCKCDVDIFIPHISQINQSDLEFLQKLSRSFNATFSIKNNTLLFLNDNKQKLVSTYTIDENECFDYELEYSNKTQYHSCCAVFHDTKTNEKKEIFVGDKEPIYKIYGNYQDENIALLKAKKALIRVNKGTIKGSFSTYGQIIEAGAKLRFKDQNFQITSVNHSVNSDLWSINVEFEN